MSTNFKTTYNVTWTFVFNILRALKCSCCDYNIIKGYKT